jgi:hypothetical protein
MAKKVHGSTESLSPFSTELFKKKRSAGSGAGKTVHVLSASRHATPDDVHARLPAIHMGAYHRAALVSHTQHIQCHCDVLHTGTARAKHTSLLPELPSAFTPLRFLLVYRAVAFPPAVMCADMLLWLRRHVPDRILQQTACSSILHIALTCEAMVRDALIP